MFPPEKEKKHKERRGREKGRGVLTREGERAGVVLSIPSGQPEPTAAKTSVKRKWGRLQCLPKKEERLKSRKGKGTEEKGKEDLTLCRRPEHEPDRGLKGLGSNGDIIPR